MGATPEERFMFDSGECATKTPFCSIRSSSASLEWTQCAMIQG